MATKVKPSRINITWAAQVWQTPVYVDEDCFQWWDIPTDNCQLANGCWYQFTSCMVCDFVSPNNTTYPTTEAVCCYVWQKIAWAYKYKWTVADYEDLPTTWLSEWDVYNITNAHATAPEFPAWANVAWTWSSWDVLWWVFDLSCKQDVLTAWPNITLSGATISWDFNYATSSTAAACTTKCVCIPEITQLCVGQQITVMPKITATNCATSLKLNDFTAYPIRYNNAALTSTTDWYVRWADCLSTFIFDWSYWRVASKSYDVNTTYTMNYSVDAWKYKAWSGSYAISRYTLAMEKGDGTWEKLTATNANYSTWTSKWVNTNWFKLWHIRYYNTTTVVANGALIWANTMYNKAASVDLRYSTNCGWVTNWLEWDYMYIVGTMWNDWLFYLDTTTRWSNKLPTTNDGKLYIRIWICLAAWWYTCSLLDYRPVYYYDNWIKEYKVADNKQDTLVSGTNIKTINWCNVLWSWDLCIAWWVTSVNGQTWAVCLTIPTDNCELTNWCWYTTCTGTVTATDLQCYVQCCDMSWYQLTCNMVCDLTWADNTHYPSAKAVADAIQCAWGWDMTKAVYDPCGCNDDAFDYCNFYNTPTIPDVSCLAQCCDIPTNNCQLLNGCWYTTCTWTVSTCADIISKLWYTPYNSTNPNWYTTCTWTLVASDIANLAQCCDIPTDNCQLANWCGYTTCTGTLSTCTDITTALGYTPYSTGNPCNYINNFAGVVSALWYTPYNNTNPCWFTTCTWTLTSGDLAPYAMSCTLCTVATSWKYCDLTWQPTIPTDNCQLANGCWYTTCTWTLVPSDIACINGCCLTNGWDICIQWGSWIQNDTTWTTDIIDCIWSWTKAEFDLIAHCCDNYYIVTDAWTPQSLTCSDVVTALWYTPYNSSNPNWYTSCTWDISYNNFEFSTASWATVTISNLSTKITPSANFTVNAWTVKEWMQYVLRVNSWATAYTMSLWTWISNPFGEDLTLTSNKSTTVIMLAISSSSLEVFSILTAS